MYGLLLHSAQGRGGLDSLHKHVPKSCHMHSWIQPMCFDLLGGCSSAFPMTKFVQHVLLTVHVTCPCNAYLHERRTAACFLDMGCNQACMSTSTVLEGLRTLNLQLVKVKANKPLSTDDTDVRDLHFVCFKPHISIQTYARNGSSSADKNSVGVLILGIHFSPLMSS